MNMHDKHGGLDEARKAADKLGIADATRHIFLCCDGDEAGCASRKQMKKSWEHLRKRLAKLGLRKRGGVFPSQSKCLDICKEGPIAVVYPDGVWYGHCTEEVLDLIIEEHLVGGKVVEEHVIVRNPLSPAPDA
ncbi:MAG: hypothetical protein BIFFINMI_03409 [Phycisphaerae bacterium]|nr:hypothetical protein [Phycisphaerae bacterium]